MAEPNIGLFEPIAGPMVTPSIPSAGGPGHGQYVIDLWLSHAQELAQPRDTPALAISDLATAQVSAWVGLFDVIGLGVSVPAGLARISQGIDDPTFHWRPGMADPRVQLSLPILDGRVVDLAFVNRVSLPLGAADVPLSDRGPTWAADVVLEVSPSNTLALAARLGFRMRPATDWVGAELDDELTGAIGMRHSLSPAFGWFAEVDARLGVGGQVAGRVESSLVGRAGLSLRAGRGVEIDVGGGSGAVPTPHGYGTPLWRAFIALRVSSTPCADADCAGLGNDRDGDGLSDGADACPDRAEDHDGFVDEDGCPDLDDDADGVLDPVDACRDDTEDADGFDDADGCPDPDNDGDGIEDERDRCPDEPGEGDGCGQ